jgi:hypothetical protein
MRSSSLIARIEALEAAAGMAAKVHFIWAPDGVDVKAEIAARIGDGSASAGDRFYSFAWRASGPEQTMHPDTLSPNVGPRPSPAPANDWPE